MIELDEIKYRLTPYEKELDEIKDALDLQNKEERIIELERTMEAPGFWDDMDKAQKYMKELKNLKDSIETYNNLKSLYDDILVLIEMGEESEDAEIAEEAKSSMDEFASKVDEVKIKTLLSGEYDKYNAILKLRSHFLQQISISSQETSGSFIVRSKYLFRCSFFYNDTACHKDNSVGNVFGESHFVGYDDHGDMQICQGLDNL